MDYISVNLVSITEKVLSHVIVILVLHLLGKFIIVHTETCIVRFIQHDYVK